MPGTEEKLRLRHTTRHCRTMSANSHISRKYGMECRPTMSVACQHPLHTARQCQPTMTAVWRSPYTH